MIAISSLTLLFLFGLLGLINQRQLLPGIVVLGTFILFVLWLTGLIETSIQLYGPKGSVNSYCSAYKPSSGPSQATLAWLETNGLCMDWKAAFSFLIVGTIFLLWMMVMAWQVNRDDFEWGAAYIYMGSLGRRFERCAYLMMGNAWGWWIMDAYIPLLVCFYLEASIIYRQGLQLVILCRYCHHRMIRRLDFYVIPSSIAFLATQLLHTT